MVKRVGDEQVADGIDCKSGGDARWGACKKIQAGVGSCLVIAAKTRPTIPGHSGDDARAAVNAADALVFNGDGTQVAVARDGNVQFHKVTVARDFGTEVEVRDGIKPGDELILKPQVALADGSKVRPQAQTTAVSER